MKTQIEIGNFSDVGKVRQTNEDYYGSYNGSFGKLVIVCDGMGGHKGGAMASRLAVDTIKESFESLQNSSDPKNELRSALQKADLKLKETSASNEELKEMGSTAVIFLLKNDQAFIAHIGDSRIYMIRNNKIHQLTKDHSLVQKMIDGNIITAEAAREHPKKNVITRALGADGSSESEVAEPFQVFKNDKFVLCTDGLTGCVDENEIMEVVSKNSVHASCCRLVGIANERGGKDNITVQVVNVIKGKSLPKQITVIPDFLKNKKIRVYSAVVLFITVLIIFLRTVNPFNIMNLSKPKAVKSIIVPVKEDKKHEGKVIKETNAPLPEAGVTDKKNGRSQEKKHK